MVSEKEKKNIKLEIEKRIQVTEKKIESLREQTKPIAPDRAIGRITRMDAIQQKSINEANLRSSEESLHNLKKALQKLDDPNFGACILCQSPIPLERILALPETTRCISCAS